MLSVMLFIHGVKLFHHHPNNSVGKADLPGTVISEHQKTTDAECGICEYQLAKETSDHCFYFKIAGNSNVVIYSGISLPQILCTCSPVNDDRGPPFLI